MTLPHFLIIGAQKAGTTWLARRLGGHPQVFLPRGEVHFFDVEANYARGADWYREQFAGAAPGQTVGEKTPDYLWVNRPPRAEPAPTARRIRDLLPEARLIVTLRDPVARAVSALGHHVWLRRFPPSAPAGEVFFGRYRDRAEHWGLLPAGLYYRQLEEYFRHFPPERIQVLVFEEDIRGRPHDTLAAVCAFLGIAGTALPEPAAERPANRGVRSRLALALNYHLPWAAPALQRSRRPSRT